MSNENNKDSNNELLLNELLVSLTEKFPFMEIQDLRTSLLQVLNKYDVAPKTTSLATIDQMPKSVKDYLVIRKGEGVAMSTLKVYAMALKNFVYLINMPLDQVKLNDIRLFLENQQTEHNWSNRYKDLQRTIIATFFKWCQAEGYLPNNPAANLKPVKYTREQKGSLTDEQLEILITACENKRDKALIELFASTGCRVSEVINIKRQDVDFEKNSILVRGKGDKVRKVFFKAREKVSLQEYLEERTDDNEYLFVYNREPYSPFTRSGIEALVKRLGKSVGIEVYPHKLRHTMATMCVKKGMPIQDMQKILGHVNINTTMVYTEIADDSVQQNHQRYAF